MFTGFNGRVVLSWASLYVGVQWLLVGLACTLLTRRRGLYVAAVVPMLVQVLPAVVVVRAPGAEPTIQLLRYGGDLSAYWNHVIIPVFASLVGGLAGELVNPSYEE